MAKTGSGVNLSCGVVPGNLVLKSAYWTTKDKQINDTVLHTSFLLYIVLWDFGFYKIIAKIKTIL